MERVIEKFKDEKHAARIIADYLIMRATKEPEFIDKLLNEKKNMNECMSYVTAQAKKQQSNNCAVIDDQTVFSWAIHYFWEDELEEWKPTNARVTTSKAKTEDEDIEEESDFETKSVSNQKAAPKVEPKKPKGVAEGQISLFDILET